MPKQYGQTCPVARSLEFLGERWTLLIVRDLLMGPRRFQDFSASLSGVAPAVLSHRLKVLEKNGIVTRRLYLGTSASRRVLPDRTGTRTAARRPRARNLGRAASRRVVDLRARELRRERRDRLLLSRVQRDGRGRSGEAPADDDAAAPRCAGASHPSPDSRGQKPAESLSPAIALRPHACLCSCRATNAFTISRARSVCGPGVATHSCSHPSNTWKSQSPPAAL